MAATTSKALGVYVPQNLIMSFSRAYQAAVKEVMLVEKTSNLNQIVRVNFQVYKIVSAFQDAVQSYANRNITTSAQAAQQPESLVLLSTFDMEALDRERTLRLIRSSTAYVSNTVALGNTFLASLDPNNLRKTLEEAVRNKTSGAGGGAGGDEDNEEANPKDVNLSNAGGLYKIQNTDDALLLDQLVGYQDEAREILSYTRSITFKLSNSNQDGGQSDRDRNPVVIILYGPPGTGKTTIAQSIARAIDSVYMYVNAENVTSKWAGETEKNIAKIFRRARIASLQNTTNPNNPRRVLLLIDEIDGLIKNRATSSNLSTEEYARVTTFLQQLTPPIGTNNSNIVAIFTTNRIENLDGAVVSRARGRIFMGYIVKPEDRVSIAATIYKPYVKSQYGPLKDNAQLKTAMYTYDDLVPRDLQNVISKIQNVIIDKLTRNKRDPASLSERFEIDLINDDNDRITLAELLTILKNTSPVTDATSLFASYNPPLAHVCAWLTENKPVLQYARSAKVYKAHGKQCQ